MEVRPPSSVVPKWSRTNVLSGPNPGPEQLESRATCDTRSRQSAAFRTRVPSPSSRSDRLAREVPAARRPAGQAQDRPGLGQARPTARRLLHREAHRRGVAGQRPRRGAPRNAARHGEDRRDVRRRGRRTGIWLRTRSEVPRIGRTSRYQAAHGRHSCRAEVESSSPFSRSVPSPAKAGSVFREIAPACCARRVARPSGPSSRSADGS